MKDYIINSLEQSNAYIENIDIKSATKNDYELVRTIRISFIHILGEIAYVITLIEKDRNLIQKEKNQLFIKTAETLRKVTISLKELCVSPTNKEENKKSKFQRIMDILKE